MAFYPGQRVVCVDGEWPNDAWYGWEELPVKGGIYTIRETGRLIPNVVEEVVRLEEIRNETADYDQGFFEAAFVVDKFRPLDEKRLDVFRAMLAPKPKVRENSHA